MLMDHLVQSEGYPVANDVLARYACQILSALLYLSHHNVHHVGLDMDMLHLDETGHVKLFGYGLGHLTGYGTLVDYPVQFPRYLSPEVLAGKNLYANVGSKDDVWALGLVIYDLHYGRESRELEHALDMAWRLELHKQVREDEDIGLELAEFLMRCLDPDPLARYDLRSLLSLPFLSEIKLKEWTPRPDISMPAIPLVTHEDLFYYWRLIGGNIDALVRKSLVHDKYSILAVPSQVQKVSLEAKTDTSVISPFFSRGFATLDMGRVWQVLDKPLDQRIPDNDWKNATEWKAENISVSKFGSNPDVSGGIASNIRYLYDRALLFRKLLVRYPLSREQILQQAVVDVPFVTLC